MEMKFYSNQSETPDQTNMALNCGHDQQTHKKSQN